ncbi:hypothetical protein PLESTB_000377600 [Pleodorina starrii]|uniref:DNA 3'-5' helicase n=1 Tax=Pleodorina starrii TaxID=330485 RepID=A0A9W6BF80_9CHLO|nr:hypothetical protein PLESTM_000017300 [Pleodorina starrii]GLC50421.1 hypothetical protein PLESTB_000377600 [Pleodorina starrii]GLC64197.1 hypothetical protein PLESTF_000135000 [Pleodorina starrii]
MLRATMLIRHHFLRSRASNTESWRCLALRPVASGWNAASRGRQGRQPACQVSFQDSSAEIAEKHGIKSTDGSRVSSRPSSPSDGLNEGQREAVLTTAQVARVKAGPGSGKTREVVARAHHLITACGVDPRRILAITFTNKAAQELRERLEAALGSSNSGGGSSSSSSSGSGGRDDMEGLGISSGRQQQQQRAAEGTVRHAPTPMVPAPAVPAPAAAPRRPGQQVVAKTFHGLGSHILRRSLKMAPRLVSELGLDAGFKVLEADQSRRLLKEAVQKVEQQEADTEAAAVASSSSSSPSSSSFWPSSLQTRELSALVDVLAGFFSAAKTDLAARGHHDDATAVTAGPRAVGARLQQLRPRMGGERGRSFALEERLSEAAVVQKYYSSYQSLLRRNNAVDFADLICLPVRLLDEHAELRDSWRAMFDHILVDEFQDTDAAQYKLVRLLLHRSAALFVVGDPDQAIYTWRGAEIGNMRTYLQRDFPDTATHHLPVNYRSVPEIVACADAVLQYGHVGVTTPGLYERQVAARPHGQHRGGGAAAAAIHVSVYPRPEDEARAVVRRIVDWARGHGGTGGASGGGGGRALRGLDRIAVLYRRRDQSRPVEEALTLSGVPYVVVAGQPFWEYKEIADTVAYLHLVLDPLRSDVMLERIINEPKRGLGGSTVDSLRQAARAAGLTLGSLLFGDCCGGSGSSDGDGGGDRASGAAAAAQAPGIAASSPLASVKLKRPALKGVQELRGLVCRLRALAAGGATVDRLVDAVLKLSGYEAALRERSDGAEGGGGGAGRKTTATKKDAAEEAGERLERLESLLELAARPDAWLAAAGQEADEPDASDLHLTRESDPRATQQQQQQQAVPNVGLAGLARFLEHAALVTGADTDPKDDRSAVRLMTLHASKGLEFQWVFILGLEDGVLPSHRTDDKDEERRLFYVGVTRAEDRLFLSRCEARFNFDGWRQMQPSPFLRAIGL